MTTLQESHALALTKARLSLAMRVVEAARMHLDRQRQITGGGLDSCPAWALASAIEAFDAAEEPEPAPAAPPPAPSPDERWREAYKRGRLAGREECAKLLTKIHWRQAGQQTPLETALTAIRAGKLAEGWGL